MADYKIPVEIWHETFAHILHVELWEPIYALSHTWRARKYNYDIKSRHQECWNRQGSLRLVSRRWKALVETYPRTWLRLRLRWPDMSKRGDALSMPPIVSSYTYFHLEHGLPTSVTGVSNTNGITTLSILLRHSSLIFSLQRALDALPRVPRLKALHVELPFTPSIDRKATSSVVFRLLQAVGSSLSTFHLTTETPVLNDQSPINLPKLQYFRLRSARCYLDSISIEGWQLPSLLHLEASLLGGRYMLGQLAGAFGTQLLSLSCSHVFSLEINSFWKKFPTLTSLQLQADWPYFVRPPVHHPIRELVLFMNKDSSRSFQALIFDFLRAPDLHTQGLGQTSASGCRKVVLAGLTWRKNCRIVGRMMLPNASWDKIAPYVEDEFGETLASAKFRFGYQGIESVRTVRLHA
jgi:hypothetical protein